MQKEGSSRLQRFMQIVTSKAFRDSAKSLVVMLILILLMVSIYFYVINKAEKLTEKRIEEINNGNLAQVNLGITGVSAECVADKNALKTKIIFNTAAATKANVRLSGNGKILELADNNLSTVHSFVFDMDDKDYGFLFVYTILASDDTNRQEQMMGKIIAPRKPETKNNSASISVE